ncbi:hypothetical protein RP20_CCG008214 [Aedes albopictus]|nr:hypothetical protein RP20_CCG008214 [Aedes albopictus]
MAMFYWHVSAETLKSEKVPPRKIHNPTSLAQKSLIAYVERLREASEKENVTAEIERLPTHIIMDVLEEMCGLLEVLWILRKLLKNPRIISRILQDREKNQTKLVARLQWLELFDKSIVSDMVANFCSRYRKKPKKGDLHPLGYEATLRLGTFLSETGWHNEASKVLYIARKQAKQRPMEQLRAIRPQLISQTYIWHSCALKTSRVAQSLLESNTDLPKPFMASLYLAISIYQYETYSCDASHTNALKAFELLDDDTTCNRLIVEVFSQLAKTCVSQKQPQQAKLMITQAVSRAWHNFGQCSAIYAHTLENYAIYLIMMSSPLDSRKVFSEAVHILLKVYGGQNLTRTVTKGNLSFDYYFKCAYIYSDRDMAETYIKNHIELNAHDHRQVMAIRRVYALLQGTTGRFGLAAGYNGFPRDVYQPIQTQQSVAEVRRLFDELHDAGEEEEEEEEEDDDES